MDNRWPPPDFTTKQVNPEYGVHPEFDQPTEKMYFPGPQTESAWLRAMILLGKTAAVMAALIVVLMLAAAVVGMLAGIVSAVL